MTPEQFRQHGHQLIDLIADDRPYAGVLLVNFGYNARNGDRLRTTQLALGMVGPSAQGKQVQDAVHGVLDDEKFMGWKNQLHDEPVFRLIHDDAVDQDAGDLDLARV